MWIDKNNYVIRCDCGDLRHLISLWFSPEQDFPDYDELEISLVIEDAGFWKRIKNAILYVFNQRKFWHYGEIMINLWNKDGQKELEGLIKFLQKYLERSKKRRKITI